MWFSRLHVLSACCTIQLKRTTVIQVVLRSTGVGYRKSSTLAQSRTEDDGGRNKISKSLLAGIIFAIQVRPQNFKKRKKQTNVPNLISHYQAKILVMT